MSDCIFCKIMSGEIPSYKVFEDDEFLVILDRFPSKLGHMLILPKQHVANVYEIDEELGARLFKLAIQYAKKLREVLGCDGVNILQNNGEVAGQTLFHFHVHVIPRYENDTIQMGWTPTDPPSEAFERILKLL